MLKCRKCGGKHLTFRCQQGKEICDTAAISVPKVCSLCGGNHATIKCPHSLSMLWVLQSKKKLIQKPLLSKFEDKIARIITQFTPYIYKIDHLTYAHVGSKTVEFRSVKLAKNLEICEHERMIDVIEKTFSLGEELVLIQL